MSIPSASTYTDFNGLAALKADARERSPEALRETARQFEALFIQMMLKSMRDASVEGGLFDSDQGRMYQEMFHQQVALDMSRGQGIGLQEMMVRQLGGGTPPTSPNADFPMPGVRMSPAAAAPGGTMEAGTTEAVKPETASTGAQAAGGTDVWNPGSPAEFTRGVWPHAERAARRLGVDPGVLVAQAALETGWGQHMTRHADGSPSYNLFNIKATGGWRGERVEVDTTEYVEGVAQRERAEFRAYASPAESFDDYVRLVGENPRYRRALEAAGDARRYVQELQSAGYATDPTYADKIMTIMERGSFSGFVAELKNGATLPTV